MNTKWQCPYCGEIYEENRTCCGENHCFEFDADMQCPECGSGDTRVCVTDTTHGEVIYSTCHECGHDWNHG